jgi:hypothetical protein
MLIITTASGLASFQQIKQYHNAIRLEVFSNQQSLSDYSSHFNPQALAQVA